MGEGPGRRSQWLAACIRREGRAFYSLSTLEIPPPQRRLGFGQRRALVGSSEHGAPLTAAKLGYALTITSIRMAKCKSISPTQLASFICQEFIRSLAPAC